MRETPADRQAETHDAGRHIEIQKQKHTDKETGSWTVTVFSTTSADVP